MLDVQPSNTTFKQKIISGAALLLVIYITYFLANINFEANRKIIVKVKPNPRLAFTTKIGEEQLEDKNPFEVPPLEVCEIKYDSSYADLLFGGFLKIGEYTLPFLNRSEMNRWKDGEMEGALRVIDAFLVTENQRREMEEKLRNEEEKAVITYDERMWNWCHDPLTEKICKSNFPLSRKKHDFLFLLDFIGDVLTKNGVKWWIDYNTLYGALRINKFLPWDYSVSISVIDDDFRSKYASIMSELHSCDMRDRTHPVFWKSKSNFTNLIGSFVMKREPQFEVQITPWVHNSSARILLRAGWDSPTSASSINPNSTLNDLLDNTFPLIPVDLEGKSYPQPGTSLTRLIEKRFLSVWSLFNYNKEYYFPQYDFGSKAMREIRIENRK